MQCAGRQNRTADCDRAAAAFTLPGASDLAAPLPAPENPTPVEAMAWRLRTPQGKQLYGLRKQTPEPVFGIIKSVYRNSASSCCVDIDRVLAASGALSPWPGTSRECMRSASAERSPARRSNRGGGAQKSPRRRYVQSQQCSSARYNSIRGRIDCQQKRLFDVRSQFGRFAP